MSKSSKKSKHDTKMKMKRAAKAAKKAKYEALRGTSKRAKRQVKGTGVASNEKHAHRISNCGNPGCNKCFPQFVRKACAA